MDETAIRKAYNRLIVAKQNAHFAAILVAQARTELKKAIAQGLASGVITGKNADEREANAALALPEQHKTNEDANRYEATAHLELDIAQIEVECLRMLMRAEELAVREPLPAVESPF